MPETYSIEEAAHILHVCAEEVMALVRACSLKMITINGEWRITAQSVRILMIFGD